MICIQQKNSEPFGTTALKHTQLSKIKNFKVWSTVADIKLAHQKIGYSAKYKVLVLTLQATFILLAYYKGPPP